ncbi:major facilitator superfamily MFS_1 [Solidesulfovibrio carbinoliphilus subsp. oakridgensis]|uniref:Major facilitator superfamily MFS_1 n=1 Tax=Solidesulfovibrio carbinoliphilus subsp. oakridgensis TaxID=694327 RepID=G7Q4V6_9BACT|nr:MFS transporter [Solidesulfovibrio carbinoliphilus]EHJ47566.1 major facilitator superfamily MFS_1 [Solidesulfovibrio carbinoliphilus subsp. oakridgensis]
MSDTGKEPAERLFGYDFTVLTLAATFGFCNIAIFYGFASYLERLGIDPAWRGVLLGAEPLAAFCLRPFLSVLVTPRNALAVARIALAAMGVALCCYQFARGVGPILGVRLFHGLAFVCLVSAVIVLLSRVIPPRLAGRAFGYFSLSALVPYAVMPPLTEWLLPRLGSEDAAYAACSLLVLPGLALLAPLGRRLGRRAMAGVQGTGRPRLADLRQDLALPPVRLILLANLCVFLSTTLIFFFMKPFALGLGLADPGLFFTVSTAASILVRVAGGSLYDRLPKEIPLLAALAGLAGVMAGFAATTGVIRFLILAGGYGLSLGVALPLLNAVMFGHSPAHLRGVNMNLMLFMMDAGYVAGPMAGGMLLAAGAGYPKLFWLCAVCAAASGLCILPLAAGRWQGRRQV